jgi:hypothetical protein
VCVCVWGGVCVCGGVGVWEESVGGGGENGRALATYVRSVLRRELWVLGVMEGRSSRNITGTVVCMSRCPSADCGDYTPSLPPPSPSPSVTPLLYE